MKRFIAFTFCSVIIFNLKAQEFKFNISYSNSSLTEFNKSIGFETGISKILKTGNKLGFLILCNYNPFDYGNIKKNLSGPNSYIVEEIEPNSISLGFQTNYSFQVYHKENATIYLGPQLSLYNFLINESIHRLPYGEYTERTYTDKHFAGGKLAIGVLLEYSIKGVILDNLDFTSSVSSRIGNYEELFAMGSIDPWFYLSIDFKVGFNYRFGMKEN